MRQFYFRNFWKQPIFLSMVVYSQLDWTVDMQWQVVNCSGGVLSVAKTSKVTEVYLNNDCATNSTENRTQIFLPLSLQKLCLWRNAAMLQRLQLAKYLCSSGINSTCMYLQNQSTCCILMYKLIISYQCSVKYWCDCYMQFHNAQVFQWRDSSDQY